MKSLTDFLKGLVHTGALLTRLEELHYGESNPLDTNNKQYVHARAQLYKNHVDELLRAHNKSPAYNRGRDLMLANNRYLLSDLRGNIAQYAHKYLTESERARTQTPHPDITGAAADTALARASKDSKAISTQEAETYHVTPVHAATR